MTDLYVVVWIMILLLLTQPGLALGINLLLPGVSERAALRLDRTPAVSFGVGFVVAGFFFIVGGIGSSVIAPWMGGIFSGILLGIYALGAAGMSRLFGERIASVTGDYRFVRDTAIGAVVLELACFVPLIGWFLFFPFVLALNTGAALFALIGWAPREKAVQPEVNPAHTVEWSTR
ncbi:MAG: hypothetical protein ACFB51_17100 [Anaerolineae bacterium]